MALVAAGSAGGGIPWPLKPRKWPASEVSTTSAMARLALVSCITRWKTRPEPVRVSSQVTPGWRCVKVWQTFWAPSSAREEYHTTLPSRFAASGTPCAAAGAAPAATAESAMAATNPIHIPRLIADLLYLSRGQPTLSIRPLPELSNRRTVERSNALAPSPSFRVIGLFSHPMALKRNTDGNLDSYFYEGKRRY